jgi:hypothetical protein
VTQVTIKAAKVDEEDPSATEELQKQARTILNQLSEEESHSIDEENMEEVPKDGAESGLPAPGRTSLAMRSTGKLPTPAPTSSATSTPHGRGQLGREEHQRMQALLSPVAEHPSSGAAQPSLKDGEEMP